MPLFLVTSVDDEGIYDGRFRLVDAPSAAAVAQQMLDHPFHWETILSNTGLWWDLTCYERRHGEPLGWTAEELLERIAETHVDGDSRNQVRISPIDYIERIPTPPNENTATAV